VNFDVLFEGAEMS
jgi:hypothetical protein